jgi:hypothetical protein
MNDAGVPEATIGFLLYHRSAPVVDFRYLSRPETLVLDWDDPWYTAFENPNLTRHHRWPQMTFLYIEPREVRHESLVRVRDLMEWTEDTSGVRRVLSEADQARLKAAAGKFFRDRNPVTIDGSPMSRSDFRAEFLAITPRGLQSFETGAVVDASSALIGISESYWTDHLPQTTSVEWQLFDDRIERVPTNIIDPAGPYPGFINAEDPRLSWTNFINDWREPAVRPLPSGDGGWLSMTRLRMALLGTPSEDMACLVVGELLRRHALAFLERNPESRDRALSVLMAETAPAGVLRELERIFAIPTTGGGVAGVTALGQVQAESLSPVTDGEGFRMLSSWISEIKGQHWGHVDQRRVQFRALIDVGEIDGNWKLLNLTVLEARTLGG